MVNVLFLCTHNAARSLLAEAMLNHLATQRGVAVMAYSAGSAPSGRPHPVALQVLAQAGVATTALRSKSWHEFAQTAAPPLSIIITVCDSAAAEPCPVFHGATNDAAEPPVLVHWGYPDPSRVEGDADTVHRAFEATRQALGARLGQLLALPLETLRGPSLRDALLAIRST